MITKRIGNCKASFYSKKYQMSTNEKGCLSIKANLRIIFSWRICAWWSLSESTQLLLYHGESIRFFYDKTSDTKWWNLIMQITSGFLMFHSPIVMRSSKGKPLQSTIVYAQDAPPYIVIKHQSSPFPTVAALPIILSRILVIPRWTMTVDPYFTCFTTKIRAWFFTWTQLTWSCKRSSRYCTNCRLVLDIRRISILIG